MSSCKHSRVAMFYFLNCMHNLEAKLLGINLGRKQSSIENLAHKTDCLCYRIEVI